MQARSTTHTGAKNGESRSKTWLPPCRALPTWATRTEAPAAASRPPGRRRARTDNAGPSAPSRGSATENSPGVAIAVATKARVIAVTSPRSNVDIIVTEFGVADLRGKSLSERAEALVTIAAPHHHDALRGSERE